MDFSNEMHKPIGYDKAGNFVYPKDFIKSKDTDLKTRLASLYAYLKEHLKIKETPKVIITNNKTNATNPFGKTAYYDPEKKIIRLYVTDRHDTDILRSFAHEVIHHWQNENGTLTPQNQQGDVDGHYAQNDVNLRKREMEAYLFGNILFRDWQDENRYGPPKTPPIMPQPINENLIIQHSGKVKTEIKLLIQKLVNSGAIGSYHRDATSGDMDANDFVEDFTNALVSSLNKYIEMVNNRGNRESQPNMIK